MAQQLHRASQLPLFFLDAGVTVSAHDQHPGPEHSLHPASQRSPLTARTHYCVSFLAIHLAASLGYMREGVGEGRGGGEWECLCVCYRDKRMCDRAWECVL